MALSLDKGRLNEGAYFSDLAIERYCVAYSNGGVYPEVKKGSHKYPSIFNRGTSRASIRSDDPMTKVDIAHSNGPVYRLIVKKNNIVLEEKVGYAAVIIDALNVLEWMPEQTVEVRFVGFKVGETTTGMRGGGTTFAFVNITQSADSIAHPMRTRIKTESTDHIHFSKDFFDKSKAHPLEGQLILPYAISTKDKYRLFLAVHNPEGVILRMTVPDENNELVLYNLLDEKERKTFSKKLHAYPNHPPVRFPTLGTVNLIVNCEPTHEKFSQEGADFNIYTVFGGLHLLTEEEINV